MIVPGGGFLLPSSRVPGVCPGGRGMVLGEIDTCIILENGDLQTMLVTQKRFGVS